MKKWERRHESDCDSFSRQALYRVIAQVEELRLDHNESLKVEGVVVNQFTGQTSLHQNLVDELLAEGLPVLPGQFHDNSLKGLLVFVDLE
jgi:cellulose biosynthesis protein BcsQ